MSELKLRPPKDKEPAGSRRYEAGHDVSCPYRPLREPGGRPRGAMVSGPPWWAAPSKLLGVNEWREKGRREALEMKGLVCC